MLLKNTATSNITLSLHGEDRILKPGEAVEGSEELLRAHAELREVKKVKVAHDHVDTKTWVEANGPVPDGKVLRQVTPEVLELVDEYMYEEVPRESQATTTPTMVREIDELPFADGRVVEEKKSVSKRKED